VVLLVLSAATAATASATSNGVMAWGWGGPGQLGDGSFHNSDSPLTLSEPVGVTAMSAGDGYSLALLESGAVMAWGWNLDGELGDGTTESSDVPVEVKGLKEVMSISAGAFAGVALLKDGKVMAWGERYGDVPVEVEGLSNVVAVAAGRGFFLALLENGKVMAWGESEYGQLGDGSTAFSEKPVYVTGLTNVTAISAGYQGALALKEGRVMAWGNNEHGSLGDGTSTGPEECPVTEEKVEVKVPCSKTPVEVTGLTEVKAISIGGPSLALLSGGTVKAWGNNEQGELGDGSSTGPEECREVLVYNERAHERKILCSTKPVKVEGLSEVTAISAGGLHALALLSSGRVKAWGDDQYGELGNGTEGGPEGCTDDIFEGIIEGAGCSRTAIEVSEFDQAAVAGIAGGAFHSLAWGPPGPVVTSVAPTLGSASGKESVTIRGSHFLGATAVHFGATAAESFEVISATEIKAVSPAESPGKVHVTVTTPSGTIATSSTARSASDFKYVRSAAPEYGRCVKVAKGTGKYTTGVCTTEKSGESNEWIPGVEKDHFTLAGEEGVLETVGKSKIVCKAATGSGEYSGTKEVVATTITFTGCARSGVKCESSGAAEGEVVSRSLEGALGWEEYETASVALNLQPVGEVGPLMEFRCGSTPVTVQGSVIVPLKANKMVGAATLKFVASKGKQKPEELEGEGKDVLETSFGEAFEQTGLTVTLTQTNEEEVEVNASV
jgi:alpha-tubulin suppressor-like RCC1 family protein